MDQTILVVDDEVKITEILRAYLEKAGYRIMTAFDGKSALEMAEREKPDFMILDLMLPDMSGEEVCRILRKKSNIPIIMLTAKAGEAEMVQGLEYGADDYVVKPFSPRNVVARVEAVLRRYHVQEERASSAQASTAQNQGCLTIDFEYRKILKEGKEVYLTPSEYKIFECMALAPNRVFTREQLIETALGNDFEGFDRSIDSFIKHIRQKIEPDRKEPRYIVTVFGVGYKFVPQGGQGEAR